MAFIDSPKSPAKLRSVGRQARVPQAALEHLFRLHAEQADNAKRMIFLENTADTALVLLLLAAAALLVGAGTGLALCFAWSLLMLLGISALIVCHIKSMVGDHVLLADAVKDLRVVLAYVGIAWGTGALLVLPATAGPLLVLGFAVLPSLCLTHTLRDGRGALAFLAPVTALTAAATILRPWPDAGLDAALLVLLQSGIAALALRGRRHAMPAGLALRP
jgi:hypothetical protein